jgi:hypothetical protein
MSHHEPASWDALLKQQYEQLNQSFAHISTLKPELRRELALSRLSNYIGLSKAETRRFYKTWLAGRTQGGAA